MYNLTDEEINSIVTSISQKQGRNLTPKERSFAEFFQNNFESILDSAGNKIQTGKESSLNAIEKFAIEQQRAMQQQQMGGGNIPQELLVPESQRKILEFHKRTAEHMKKGGKRIIHLTDTESSPEDLEKILRRNLSIAGGFNKKTDVIVHTGDLLQDFIDFKHMSHGLGGFRANRIIEEGGLEGKIASEFKEIYEELLEKHGVLDYQLLEERPTEQIMRGLQNLYFGLMPNFLTKEEEREYKRKFEIFKEHMKSAIKNNARTKYKKIKEILEKPIEEGGFGLTSEDYLQLLGNHDVPEIMEEVLGEYMSAAGSVATRKGLRIGTPLSGSTGSMMGPEFVDTFGYTDIKEDLERIKYESSAMQELVQYFVDKGIDFIDEKRLSNLILQSQARASQGIGKGYLAKYFDNRIKPQMDMTVEAKKGQIVNSIPKDVDLYALHGMPNHRMFAGIEELAFFKALEEAGGGNVLHGHIHGKSTHRMGKSLLLNQGDGKQGFGIYHYDKGDISDIFIQSYNQYLGHEEFDLVNKDQISVQKSIQDYGGQN